MPDESELERLKAENQALREENERLKKARGPFCVLGDRMYFAGESGSHPVTVTTLNAGLIADSMI